MREFDGTDLTGSFDWLMPPSKSHMIRWLVLDLRVMERPIFHLKNLPGEDSFSMANCLATMGSKIDLEKEIGSLKVREKDCMFLIMF